MRKGHNHRIENVAQGFPLNRLASVMALVGHKSSAVSHRYTHVGKEALARAAKTLPEI
jgi:site-specific recombinase XerD